MRNIVITGLGIISPIGKNLEENEKCLQKGISGIKIISGFDASSYSVPYAGEIDINSISEFYQENIRQIRKISRGTLWGYYAAKNAVFDSGLHLLSPKEKENIGIFMGSNIEWGDPRDLFDGLNNSLDNDKFSFKKFGTDGINAINPLVFLEKLPNSCLYYISKEFGFMGPNSDYLSDGVASSQAIINAFDAIKHGDSEISVAGGYTIGLNWYTLANYLNINVPGYYKPHSNEPVLMKPFSNELNGFVLGEGAGMVVLEEKKHAIKRGAKIYAEIIGYGDAICIENPQYSFELAISNALKMIDKNKNKISYINAHGDASEKDLDEINAYKNIFKTHDSPIISSTKPLTGYLTTGAGAVELIFSILSLNHDFIPATINTENKNANCDNNYIFTNSIRKKINSVLNVNSGYGNVTTAIIITKNNE